MERLSTRLGEPVALGVLGAVHIGLLSSLAGLVPASLIAVAAAAGTAVAAVAVGWREVRDVGRMGARGIALSASAGALACVGAPWIVALNRYTDAPPGSELIFFAWVLWGGLALLAAGLAAPGRRRSVAVLIAVGLVAVTGAAAVLASWERPSSFSPLVRYLPEELWMLLAGACFLGGGLLIARQTRAHGRARPLLVGGVAAAAVGTAVVVFGGGARTMSALSEYGGSLAVWAAAWALLWLVWSSMLAGRHEAEAGVAMTCAPLTLTGLLALETFTGVAGPNPMIAAGISGGALLAVASVLALLRRASLASDGDASGGPSRSWMLAAAAIPLTVAIAGLALPALGGSAWADRKGTAFTVSWTLAGWESVAAWIVVASAMLAFASVARRSTTLAAAALAAAAAYPLLTSTPYRTLTGWLPSDVLADLGTEYAWIHFDTLPNWPAWLALCGAVACATLVLSGRLIARSRREAAVPRMEDTP
jgi:hypothetical protein